MYTELFELCGFAPEEIESERARIDKALDIAGIYQSDVDRAQQRVTEFFDTELVAVRKVLGIYLKQFLDLVLSREEGKKIAYTTFPPAGRLGLALTLASEEVYCHAPELVVDVVMGQIFGKINPILEAAEEHGLPPGIAMCGLNQARVGAIVKGIAPLPDITLTSAFFCDQSPKTDDLLHEVYGTPNTFVDGCIDSSWDEFPEIKPRRVQYQAKELRRARGEVGKALGIEITDEMFHEANKRYAMFWFGMQQVWEMMRNEPQPISAVDLGLFYWIIALPERRALQEGMKAIGTLAAEVKRRVDEGKGVVEKGAPRVAWPLYHTTDPGILRMVESLGLSIPIINFAWVTPREREAVKSQYTTPEERGVESELRWGVYHSTSGVLYRLKETCKAWDVDGFILAITYNCRGSFALLIHKKALEQELDIPVLALECDYYDSRDYSAQALRTRVEAFAELLRSRKAA